MATSATSAATQIGIQDFLKILVAQLGNQDPLKPMDNQEFVTQLAQFTSLQQTQELNDKLGSLLTAQASMQSVGLLSKTVDFQTSAGFSTGVVKGISFSSGEPRLTVLASSGATLTDISLGELTAVR